MKFLSNYLKTTALAFLLCLPAILFAQVKFYATINANRASMGTTLQVNFVVENAGGRSFTPPAFKDFDVVGGPSTSQSFQYINGSMSQSRSWSYYIQPKREGLLTVEAAKIEVDGSMMATNELKIQVSGGSNPPAASNQSGQSGASAQSKVSPADTRDDVFMRVITNKTQAYVGEPVAVTFRLYTAKAIFDVQFPKAASFNGFWKYDLPQPQNPQWENEVLNGKRYKAVNVQQVILFPQKEGNGDITPIEMEAVVQEYVNRPPRDIFEEMFGVQEVRNVPVKIQSKKTTINVLTLPAAGRPDNYKGLVGKFTMEASIDKQEGKTDDPITLKIKVSGSGNFEAMENPAPELPADLEAYDPNIKENLSPSNSTVSGSKSFEYLIIPRAPGEYKIPPIQLSFFNPETKQYQSLSSKEFVLKITGESSRPASAQNTGSGKESVKLLKEDIRFIRMKNVPEARSEAFAGSTLYYSLLGSPFLLFLILLFVKKQVDDRQLDVTGMRKRTASKVAIKRLAGAKVFMEKRDRTAFFQEVNRALHAYLGNRLLIDTADLSFDHIKEKLVEHQATEETCKRVYLLMEQCNIALFSPSSGEGEMNNSYQEALAVITELENTLKK